MPALRIIPEQYRLGFIKINEVEDETFDSIKYGLSLCSLSSSLTALTKKIVEVTSLKRGDIQEIFFSIGSLIPLIEKQEDIKEVVENIVTLSTDKELIKPDDKIKFSERLNFLLSDTHIYYAAKSSILKTEHGSVLIGAKIISDIRPVFDINLEDTPKGGMIIHTLHLHYQSDKEGDHKDIFLALDSDDLKQLKDAIFRADKKEISLQSLLKKADLTNLNE